jgi:hypothetical protein
MPEPTLLATGSPCHPEGDMQPRTVDWVESLRQVLRQRGAEDETLLKACRKFGERATLATTPVANPLLYP